MASFRCPTCLSVLMEPDAERCPMCHQRLQKAQPIVLTGGGHSAEMKAASRKRRRRHFGSKVE
jgi:hypothetical protein